MAVLKDLIVQGVSRTVGKHFLGGDPTSDLEAATKHYVDSMVSSSGGLFFGVCSTAAATAAKEVTIQGFTLQTGTPVYVQFEYTNSAAVANLTLNISDTGAIPIKRYGTTNMAAVGNLTAGMVCNFVYDGASWLWVGHVDTNSNTIGEYAGSVVAGPFGMARYSLIMQVDENHWEGLVQTSSTGTSKVMNTNGFLLSSPILYQSGSTIAADGISSNASTWLTYSFNTRYSFNVSDTWSAQGRPLYLVGTISNGKFYLKPTTWWADALPVADDGYVYRYVGQMYSAYQVTLHAEHPIFKWIGDGWHEVNAVTLDLLARVSALESALQT